jgi:hypothetical protein
MPTTQVLLEDDLNRGVELYQFRETIPNKQEAILKILRIYLKDYVEEARKLDERDKKVN